MNTIFEAASLTKPVFTYGVLRLVDQRKLDLDTPLSSYLPKPRVPDERVVIKPACRIGGATTARFPFISPPEERFSYSGEGYRSATRGRADYRETAGRLFYMDEVVFKPLGMTNSSYVWRPSFDSVTTPAHDSKGALGEPEKPEQHPA